MNLDGKPLRYLIGGNDSYDGNDNEVTELSYDATMIPRYGIGIKYGNLFDETNSGNYAPYLPDDDTSASYNEGRIDPAGPGWNRNLDDQFRRAIEQGFTIIELDNADSYAMSDVLSALDRCVEAGLRTIAKNPMICQGARSDLLAYVVHPAVIGCIVERECGTPNEMDNLRGQAMRPTLPVWFVAFGAGEKWARNTADDIARAQYVNMGVTYSSKGEYENSKDIYVPVAPVKPPSPPDGDIPTVIVTVKAKGEVRVIVNKEEP